jgi:hypothetical protein
MNKIIAHHGTHSCVGAKIEVDGFVIPTTSRNSLWLGKGVYFFQEAPNRAAKWAKEAALRYSNRFGRHSEPMVYESEIDLTDCLDIFDISNFDLLKKFCITLSGALPEQVSLPSSLSNPRQYKAGYNFADCDVFNRLIDARTIDEHFSSIRVPMPEGAPLHPTSYLLEDSAVVVNVVDVKAIVTFKRIA